MLAETCATAGSAVSRDPAASVQDATVCGALWSRFLQHPTSVPLGWEPCQQGWGWWGGMGRAAANVTWEAPNKIH